ncbi:hypothetical protein WP2W18C05_09440 [Aeromonas sp. WP2-W18-CRE-05]|nr:hypothetical protein WP2W18C05_09440 [Aeromonas sp. WP2-W18-CRE-05]
MMNLMANMLGMEILYITMAFVLPIFIEMINFIYNYES